MCPIISKPAIKFWGKLRSGHLSKAIMNATNAGFIPGTCCTGRAASKWESRVLRMRPKRRSSRKNNSLRCPTLGPNWTDASTANCKSFSKQTFPSNGWLSDKAAWTCCEQDEMSRQIKAGRVDQLRWRSARAGSISRKASQSRPCAFGIW